jgi:hypothetical protein
MEVALVRWPSEQARYVALRDEGVPRLLLVEDGPPPAASGDPCEDWVRVPARDVDVHTRVEALRLRVAAVGPDVPSIDGDGVVRFAAAWVALPPVEARLTSALIERFGAVVSRDAMAKAGWPAGAPGRNALDVHVLRLRRRLTPVGLAITTVRSLGYLLEASGSRQQTVPDA